jgi:hypothetical protein
VFRGATPQRSPQDTWYVPYEVFPNPVYDDFCSGIAYILSNEQTKTFFEYSLNFYLPRFSDFIEDVYIGNSQSFSIYFVKFYFNNSI